MSVIRVGVNGARGKMGGITVRAVQSQEDLELAFEADAGDDLAALIADAQADVVVDFTVPACALENTLAIIAAGARPVVGTTGLDDDDLEKIGSALDAANLGGIVAPNFSLGAILMMKLAAEAAVFFDDCEIIETHHENKLDAPSGTALLTAREIARGREEKGGSSEASETAKALASRGSLHDGTRIHSVRLPGRMAHQEILFGGMGETLAIRHDAISRECFVPGILYAIRRVVAVEGLEVGLSI